MAEADKSKRTSCHMSDCEEPVIGYWKPFEATYEGYCDEHAPSLDIAFKLLRDERTKELYLS